ncbi:MAG: hypothetical protein ISF22_04730 [Methanomassiliicoccus sp.]|nr:hypothetical protein [Methanomassiliicoccus sp.]
MKLWQVFAVVALMVMVFTTGWFVQQAVNDRNHTGSWNDSAGRGANLEFIALNPSNGEYARYEVWSKDGRAMDVYFTTLDGLRAAQNGLPFDHDPRYSVLNATHARMDLRLPSTTEIYEIVIVSHDPDEVVRISSSADQWGLPLYLAPVLQAALVVLWIASIALLVLLVFSISGYRKERAGRS